jgi:signal transduction histidine kinase
VTSVHTPDAASVLDDLPDGVVLAGAGGAVEFVSALGRRMLAIEGDPVGRPLAEVLTLTDHDGNTWVDCNTPYAGLSTRTAITEQAWLLPSGTEVLVAARLHREALDRPVERLAVVLRSGRGRERLDRERSDLVATVAHELRSPLTGVKGFVTALLNRWDRLNDEQKKLMLTTVAADSDRLARLIAELLDVARIDTGRLQMHVRPTDAATLLSRIVDSVAAGTARPIELDATTELPSVMADPDKFTQVFVNLVENGVRHGEGVVSITVRPGADGIVVTVDDEGEGIAPELRRRVFTKFWKGGQRGGSGLGLYIVGGLVKAHGGTVEIDDAPGGGARIVVTWPTELAADPQTGSSATAQRS